MYYYCILSWMKGADTQVDPEMWGTVVLLCAVEKLSKKVTCKAT